MVEDVEIGIEEETGVVRPSLAMGVGSLLGVILPLLRLGFMFSTWEALLTLRLCDEVEPVLAGAFVLELELAGLIWFSMSPLWIVARPGRLVARWMSERVESIDGRELRCCRCGDASGSSMRLPTDVAGDEAMLDVLRMGCRRRWSNEEDLLTPLELEVMLA